MDIEKVLENLCYYDLRNPDVVEGGRIRNYCSCDNCFYGRDDLALEILRLRGNEEINWNEPTNDDEDLCGKYGETYVDVMKSDSDQKWAILFDGQAVISESFDNRHDAKIAISRWIAKLKN